MILEGGLPYLFFGASVWEHNKPMALTLTAFGGTVALTKLLINSEVKFNGRSAEELSFEVKDLEDRYPGILIISLIAAVIFSQFSLLIGGICAHCLGVLKAFSNLGEQKGIKPFVFPFNF
jgi:hypothetical protein